MKNEHEFNALMERLRNCDGWHYILCIPSLHEAPKEIGYWFIRPGTVRPVYKSLTDLETVAELPGLSSPCTMQ
jgi:hypothetical protein